MSPYDPVTAIAIATEMAMNLARKPRVLASIAGTSSISI
jgi:hypothetical protein